MTLSLRDSTVPTLELAQTATPINQQVLERAAMEAGDSTSFGRGWTSAGLSENANALLAKSLSARRLGDENGGAVYEQQARDLLSQAQQWAPTVRNLSDVNSVGSAAEWASGALGNIRSSVAPAVGGLAGAALGGVGGAFVGGMPGAAVGARYGAGLGSALLGGRSEYDEAVANAMLDPTIRSTRSYDDIHNAALTKGTINAGLEAAVPFGMVKSVTGLAGKQALKKAAEQGLAKTVGKEVGENMLTEGATEGVQSLVGQGTENWLKRTDLTDFDYKQALNEAAAGAVAGGGMGVAGGAGNYMHGKAGNAADAVTEFVNKPLQDKIADAGTALGERAGEKEAAAEDAQLDEMIARAEKGASAFSRRDAQDFMSVPARESELTPEAKDKNASERAASHADDILANRGRYSESEVSAAESYKQHGDYGMFDMDLSQGRANDGLKKISSEIEANTPKQSRMGMTEEGETTKKLSDLWLRDEGSKLPSIKNADQTLAADTAHKMMAWVASGYGAKYSDEGQTFMLHSLAEHFGDDVGKVIESMTEYAEQQGIMHDSKHTKRMVKEAQQHVDMVTSDAHFFDKNLTKLGNEHWTKNDGAMITRMLSDGKVSEKMKNVLRVYFGPNTDTVIDRFKRKADIAKAKSGRGGEAWLNTQNESNEDENADDYLSPKTSDSLDYETEQALQSAERVREGSRYSKGMMQKGADGKQLRDADGNGLFHEYLDTQNAEHKAWLDKATKDQTAAKGADDAVVRQAVHVGKIDRELEKLAAEKGVPVEGLTQAKRESLIAKIVHEHYPALESVPKTTVKAKSALAIKDHAERRAKYERRVAQLAAQINRRHVSLRVDEHEAQKPGINFTPAEVSGLELKNADLRDPNDPKNVGKKVQSGGTLNMKHQPSEGRILLERKGEPFPVSTQALMAKMFGVRDGTNNSTKEYEGDAQTALQYVSDAIAAIQQHEGFSGRIGFVQRGKIVWKEAGAEKGVARNGKTYTKEAQLPDDLTLWHDRKHNVKHTVGDAKVQMLAQSERETAAARKKPEPGMFTPDGVPTKGLHVDVTDFPGREELLDLQDREASGSLNPVEERKLAALLREEEKWVNGKEYEQKKLRDVRQGPETAAQVGTGSLQDDNPAKNAARKLGAHGLPEAGSDTMNAGLVTGRQVAMTKGDIGPTPTKVTPERTSRNGMDFATDKAVLAELAKEYADVRPLGSVVNAADTEAHKTKVIKPKKDSAMYEEIETSYNQQKTSELEQVQADIVSMPAVKALIADGVVSQIVVSGSLGDSLGKRIPVQVEGRKNPDIVIVLSSRLFDGSDRAAWRGVVLAHEVGHAVEGHVDMSQYHEGSEIAKMARAVPKDSKLGKILANPLSSYGEDTTFHQELHAQLFAAFAYPAGNAELRKYPRLFKQMESLYGNEGTQLRTITAAGERMGGVLGERDGDSSQEGQLVKENAGGAGSQGASATDAGNAGTRGQLAKSEVAPYKGKLLAELKTAKPVSPRHRKALLDAVAILEGTKQGDHNAALEEVVSSSEYFGKNHEAEQKHIDEMNEAIAEAKSDYDQYERDYAGEFEESQNYEQPHEEVREEAPAAQNPKAAELQKYLDKFAGKNAGWDRAAQKAIAEGNEGSLTGALAAAKRQFGELAQEQAPAQDDKVQLPVTGKFTAKDQAKSAKANKFIGRGSPASSTAKYAAAWGENANTGSYTKDDVVFVSAEGDRQGRVTPDFKELQKALNADATVITDDKANRERGYNVGERELAEYLKSHSYEETKPGSGVWTPLLFNKQSTGEKINLTAEERAAVEANVEDAIRALVGESVRIKFRKAFADGSSGSWSSKQSSARSSAAVDRTMNLIKISLNSNVMGTAFHESFHEIMHILRTNGGEKTAALLERAAMSPLMQARLSRMLDAHPEAQKQLAIPEEAAAFMFQFWMLDPTGFKIGPETKSTFQKLKDFLKSVAGLFSETIRTANQARIQAGMEAFTAEQIMREFAAGKLAEAKGMRFDSGILRGEARGQHRAVVGALNNSVAKHEAAVANINHSFQQLVDTAGKFVISAEAVMDATGNKHMVAIARMFHQKAGTAMRGDSNYSSGLRQQTSKWLNKVENIILGANKDDLELARQHLSMGTKPSSPEVKKLVDGLREYFGEMKTYIDTKKVSRYEPDAIDPKTGRKGAWVQIDFRKDYWPQAIDVDNLRKNSIEFEADLLKHHMAELQAIADEANIEIKSGTHVGDDTASATQMAKKPVDRATVTPEMVAAAITVRLQRTGNIEMSEDASSLGITPAASAVNRRALGWLDKKVFDKYMSKDVADIVSTYTKSIVKRAEYQSRFGPDGRVLRELADKAILHELGGDELITKAEKAMPAAEKAWGRAKSAAIKAGMPFDAPFPTLRSVGQGVHAGQVGTKEHRAALVAAVGKLNQGMRAVQAMEGTLGDDISPAAREINSWLVTYQNFRTLSVMLFTSFQDVNGLMVNGGKLGDAWEGFTSGLREIKNTWKNQKSDSEMMARAEAWGAVDAGSFLDAMGETYASEFMSHKAKALSDKFFKYTGAEGWNRGIRGVAANVAERIITEWKTEGIGTDKAQIARVERLFGKGFDVANIKMDENGRLDITDPANQAAITRWMLDAIPAPTAAHRPIWGSDPHFQTFMHLKNYTYTFHRVMLKGAVEQAKLGNYQPIAQLSLGYLPIAIAAGAVKEMLIPGDEPPWMKGGLGSYLEYGFARAGVLGVPQMYTENLFSPSKLLTHPTQTFDNFDPAAVFGPSTDQLQNLLSVPIMEKHTVLGEGLGALPGGNLLKRLEKIDLGGGEPAPIR